MLAAEVPEVSMEAPPELPDPSEEPVSESVAEPTPEPPSEPVPAPVEAPEPEPSAAPPTEEAVMLNAADPAEEVATEPPAYISDEPSPGMPGEYDAEPVAEDEDDAGIPPVVVPVNLNVDIRILSPGDDGDVNQVIDLGGLGPGSGNPADALGGLGLGDLDLGLDWTWNWNWEWDCGDASVAGLDWNWTWTWSGDCAAGILDPRGHGPGPLGEHPRIDRYSGMLDTLTREALGAPPSLGDEPGPVVSTRGAGGGAHARSHPQRGDDSETAPAPAPPPFDGGPWVPEAAVTSFASTGATSQSTTATAPARRPAGANLNGDPERQPAGPPAQAMGVAAAAGGGGEGGAFSVLLLAALVGALALLPPPPGGRVTAYGQKLSSLLSSSRLERPG